MKDHPRRRQIERAMEANYQANRNSYYFCHCGAEFRRGERGRYYAHKRHCKEPEDKPLPQPTQLGLFGDQQ